MIANKTRLLGLCLVLVSVSALAGCDGNDREPPAEVMPMDMPAEGMMRMDPAMMERHADEAERMAAETHEHIDEMRRMTAEQQYERMGEHVRQVSRMLGLMDRQMREMSMGMSMDDEQMGAMMGMSAEQHRQMMHEMTVLRAELEELQTASVSEIEGGMAAHLDRCERMVEMMELSAEHMRQL